MLKPIVRQGLIVPACVAVLAALVFFVAGGAAACIVLAIGARRSSVFHLIHLQRIADWAAGSLGAEFAEAAACGPRRSPRCYRHTRTRSRVRARPTSVRSSGSARRPRAAGRRGRARRGSANRLGRSTRALAQLGLDLAHDRGQPIVNLVRQPEFLRYVEAGDFAASIVVSSGRDPRRRLALQLVPFAADQKLLLSRDVTELEAVARMRRDFIANVSHELKTPLTVVAGFSRDDRRRLRGLRRYRDHALSIADSRADGAHAAPD